MDNVTFNDTIGNITYLITPNVTQTEFALIGIIATIASAVAAIVIAVLKIVFRYN